MKGALTMLPAIVLAVMPAVTPAPVAAQDTHLLVVTGLGGTPEYRTRFRDWAVGLVTAAESQGVPRGNAVWLAERADLHPRVAGESRLERVGQEVAALAARSAPDDVVVIVLFGHGTARGGEARLNLPGPDLSAGGLAVMLEALAGRRVALVNAASASGGFMEPLKAPDRVIVTATRSAAQNEATRFGGHFVEAFAGEGADSNRDGRVSILEAFEYARREVERHFGEGGRLPTEHALLEDPGELAGRIAFAAAAPTAAAATDPELGRLYARRDSLQAELSALRSRQSEMTAATYGEALDRLLLEVARNGRAIREREGGSPDA